MEQPARVGLVLGAGGVLGGAWLVGALHALRSELGWEPAEADHFVGTSAGAVMAALLAAGVSSDDLLPEAVRAVRDANTVAPDQDWILLEMATEATYRLGRSLPRLLPGSLGLCWSGIRQPGFWTPVRLLSGLAPQGAIATDAIKRTVERAPRHGDWPADRPCWLVACDYLSGERVVFGTPGAPEARLPEAVAASCAIPGFFTPERIDGRLYVDGGLGSLANLDLLAGQGLDLVICLNPASGREPAQSWSPLERIHRAFQRAAAWQLRQEAERVRRFGTPVVLIEPGAEDLALMGMNFMDAGRAVEVAQLAAETTARQIGALREADRLPLAA